MANLRNRYPDALMTFETELRLEKEKKEHRR
jgi:hypothetical protein